MSQWLGLALVGELVVIFTHFASKQPVRRIHRLLAMSLVTAAALTLCVAAAMVGWQAAPPAEVQEPGTAPVAAPSPVAPPVTLPDHKVLPNDLLSAGVMPRSVSVVGAVKIPGQFQITAPITLSEALAKAGWVTGAAGQYVLLTMPDAPAPRKISLQDLQMGTDRTLNVTLTGGEVINVPDAQKELVARFPEGPKVWVTGNIGHPLVYSIKNPADATVLKVIASEMHVLLSDIMHRKAPDVTLQADDVLLIPDSDAKQMQEYYDTHPLTPPWEKAK
jgi:protein involved in polysaccharide export with SLBB domain